MLFIEQIFLKILLSGNSSFSHRMSSLQVLSKLCCSPRILLEFFVNYDCDIGHFNAIEKITEVQGKIAQGKYAKAEYALVIQPEQEAQLRQAALEGLVQTVVALDRFLDEIEKDQSLAEGKASDNSLLNESSEQANAINDTGEVMNIDPEKYSKLGIVKN